MQLCPWLGFLRIGRVQSGATPAGLPRKGARRDSRDCTGRLNTQAQAAQFDIAGASQREGRRLRGRRSEAGARLRLSSKGRARTAPASHPSGQLSPELLQEQNGSRCTLWGLRGGRGKSPAKGQFRLLIWPQLYPNLCGSRTWNPASSSCQPDLKKMNQNVQQARRRGGAGGGGSREQQWPRRSLAPGLAPAPPPDPLDLASKRVGRDRSSPLGASSSRGGDLKRGGLSWCEGGRSSAPAWSFPEAAAGPLQEARPAFGLIQGGFSCVLLKASLLEACEEMCCLCLQALASALGWPLVP